MKIVSLKMKDFINHANSSLQLAHVNFIIGQNEQGKSSIRNAAQWALQGATRHMKTDKGEYTRKNEEGLIREGGEKAEVDMVVEHSGSMFSIHRERTKTTTKLSAEDSGEMPMLSADIGPAQDGLEMLLDYDAKAMGLVMDPFEAALMNPKDRKVVFQKYLTPSNPEILAKHLLEFGVPEDKVHSVAELIVSSGIEGAHKTINQKKLAVNTSIEEMPEVDILEQMLKNGDKEIDLKTVDLEVVMKNIAQIEKLKGIEQESLFEIKKANEGISDAKDQLVATDANIETETASISSYKKKVESFTTRIAEIAVVIKSGEGEIRDLIEEIATKTGRSVALTELRAMFDRAKTKCPTCEAAFDPKNKKKKLAEYQKDIETLDAEVNAATGNLTETQDVQDKNIIDRDELSSELSNFQSLLDQSETRLEGLNADKAAYEKASKLGMVNPDETKLDEYTTRITFGHEVVEKAHQFRTVDDQLLKRQENIDNMMRDRSTWEQIAAIIHPKSGKLIKIIEEPMNNVAKTISEAAEIYGITLEIDAQFDLIYNGRSITQCSFSEQYRGGCALVVAISIMTNTGFIALDYADTLVGPNRAKITSFINKLKDRFETVFVISSTANKPELYKQMVNAETKVWYVESGTVTEVK